MSGRRGEEVTLSLIVGRMFTMARIFYMIVSASHAGGAFWTILDVCNVYCQNACAWSALCFRQDVQRENIGLDVGDIYICSVHTWKPPSLRETM